MLPSFSQHILGVPYLGVPNPFPIYRRPDLQPQAPLIRFQATRRPANPVGSLLPPLFDAEENLVGGTGVVLNGLISRLPTVGIRMEVLRSLLPTSPGAASEMFGSGGQDSSSKQASTQRAQDTSMKEHTLNHLRGP